ncbi:MAG: hypothetical protein LC793_23630 [Thermomicrobia bacterium]|nr:hypothetical protein [Thermomicrobia bacterium]
MHRRRIGNGIRGPTRPNKANDRAGNAAVRETDRGGSGTDQPSRVSRYVCLAPAASVDGRGANVKVGGIGARITIHYRPMRREMMARAGRTVDRSGGRGIGVAGNRADVFAGPIPTFPPYTESGTASDER